MSIECSCFKGLGRCWLCYFSAAGRAQILGVIEQWKPQPTEGPSLQCFPWRRQWYRLGAFKWLLEFHRSTQSRRRWEEEGRGCCIRTIPLLPAVYIGALMRCWDSKPVGRIHELHVVALVSHLAKRSWAKSECFVLLVWPGQWLIVWNEFVG